MNLAWEKRPTERQLTPWLENMVLCYLAQNPQELYFHHFYIFLSPIQVFQPCPHFLSYLHPTKFILCCLYMCMFRTDNLGLDNLSVGLSMDKIDSPSLGNHRFPIAVDLVMEPWNTCSIHIRMLAGVIIIQVFFGQPYC